MLSHFIDWLALFLSAACFWYRYIPLLPIAYLIMLHASFYWGSWGGLTSSACLIAGYTAILLLQDHGGIRGSLPEHAMRYLFLVLVGLLGGLIVHRERKFSWEAGKSLR